MSTKKYYKCTDPILSPPPKNTITLLCPIMGYGDPKVQQRRRRTFTIGDLEKAETFTPHLFQYWLSRLSDYQRQRIRRFMSNCRIVSASPTKVTVACYNASKTATEVRTLETHRQAAAVLPEVRSSLTQEDRNSLTAFLYRMPR